MKTTYGNIAPANKEIDRLNRKIKAMQKAIDNECATCEFPKRECPHCRWNKFTKKARAK